MRKKVKGKLYFLARDAKLRMKNFYKEKSVFEQLSYAHATLSEREQELYDKVRKLLLRDEVVINPIQELVDRKYYNSLSSEAKQKYIIDLSEKYKQLKLKFEQESLYNASNY